MSDATQTHPPIPPNNDIAIEDAVETLENAWCDDEGGMTPDNEGVLRQIRANWYRCAWLDEAERIDLFYGPPHYDATAYNKAMDNAEAWRQWGTEEARP
ncbi:MAG: hypothetical protein A2W31_05125 [Planctomycetes bacterium RBG_16_64_10]|nr:MAG: hypothetical protein A2W31_05125 [Planctomycetes bacterium RBG_16_64_10]